MEQKKGIPTSEFLRGVVRANNTDRVTIDELKVSLHERGFGVLLMFFALPVSVPLPYIPGVTTVFAVPLIVLSSQMLLGFEFPWLPRWFTKRSFKRSLMRFMIMKSSPILKRVEKLLKPRLLFCSHHHGAQVIGFFSLIFAISIALPLPFTNFVPAIGIVVMSLGLLSRDGITIIIGGLIGLLGVIFTAAVLIMGKKIVMGIVGKFWN